MEWQPIATAPTDGTWFVIVRADEDDPVLEVGRYSPHYWPEYVEAGNGLYRKERRLLGEWQHFNNFHRATHWLPLPNPPQG